MKPLYKKICHRYNVETASTKLNMGHLWPKERREETLRKVRSLPTYDPNTDTVVVCTAVLKPLKPFK